MNEPTADDNFSYVPRPPESDAPSEVREGTLDWPTYHDATRRFQRDFLRATLDLLGWDITLTAARLHLARSHVYRLMRYFDLSRPGPARPYLTRELPRSGPPAP